MIKFENANETSRYYQEVEKFQKVYQVECYLLKMARYQEDVPPMDDSEIYSRNIAVENMIERVLKVENEYPTLYSAVSSATECYDTYDDDSPEGIDLRANDHYGVLVNGVEEPGYLDLIQWYKINKDRGTSDPITVLKDVADGCGVGESDYPEISDILNLGMARHWEKLFLGIRVPKEEILESIRDIRDLTGYDCQDGDGVLEDRLDKIDDMVWRLKNKLTEGENNG